jgi:hypothetical protein
MPQHPADLLTCTSGDSAGRDEVVCTLLQGSALLVIVSDPALRG